MITGPNRSSRKILLASKSGFGKVTTYTIKSCHKARIPVVVACVLLSLGRNTGRIED